VVVGILRFAAIFGLGRYRGGIGSIRLLTRVAVVGILRFAVIFGLGWYWGGIGSIRLLARVFVGLCGSSWGRISCVIGIAVAVSSTSLRRGLVFRRILVTDIAIASIALRRRRVFRSLILGIGNGIGIGIAIAIAIASIALRIRLVFSLILFRLGRIAVVTVVVKMREGVVRVNRSAWIGVVDNFAENNKEYDEIRGKIRTC